MKTKFVFAFAAAAALLLAGCGSTPGTTPSSVAPASTAAAAATQEAPVAETPTPEDTASALTAKTITLTVKTTSKKCFGSAGCNVEYRLKPVTSVPLPLDGTYEVTFSVKGDESGPQIGTFTVAEDGSISNAYDLEGYVSTPSSKTKITAAVTAVEKV